MVWKKCRRDLVYKFLEVFVTSNVLLLWKMSLLYSENALPGWILCHICWQQWQKKLGLFFPKFLLVLQNQQLSQMDSVSLCPLKRDLFSKFTSLCNPMEGNRGEQRRYWVLQMLIPVISKNLHFSRDSHIARSVCRASAVAKEKQTTRKGGRKKVYRIYLIWRLLRDNIYKILQWHVATHFFEQSHS